MRKASSLTTLEQAAAEVLAGGGWLFVFGVSPAASLTRARTRADSALDDVDAAPGNAESLLLVMGERAGRSLSELSN